MGTAAENVLAPEGSSEIRASLLLYFLSVGQYCSHLLTAEPLVTVLSSALGGHNRLRTCPGPWRQRCFTHISVGVWPGQCEQLGQVQFLRKKALKTNVYHELSFVYTVLTHECFEHVV